MTASSGGPKRHSAKLHQWLYEGPRRDEPTVEVTLLSLKPRLRLRMAYTTLLATSASSKVYLSSSTR
jgi:hypothetical protein